MRIYRSIHFLLAVLILGGLTTACGASIQERRSWNNFKYGGEVFNHVCPVVVAAGKKALDAGSLELEAEEAFDATTHALYAEAGPFLLRQGEVVRILFSSVDKGCKVSLRAEAKMSGNVLKKTSIQYELEYITALKGYLAENSMENKYSSMSEDEDDEDVALPRADGKVRTGGEK